VFVVVAVIMLISICRHRTSNLSFYRRHTHHVPKSAPLTDGDNFVTPNRLSRGVNNR